MLELGDKDFIAEGLRRDVFRHPDNPEWLIKVLKLAFIEKRNGEGAPWYNFKRLRHRYFSQLRRPHLDMHLSEIREQFSFPEVGQRHPPYLQKIVGFEDTNKGLGLIVEAVRGRDGNYARTLEKLIHAGELDRARLSKLDQFFEEIVASPVIISDLNLGNIVLGYNPKFGDHFVLIDGYGARTLIAVERFSATLNRSNKQRRIGRFRLQIEQEGLSGLTPARK